MWVPPLPEGGRTVPAALVPPRKLSPGRAFPRPFGYVPGIWRLVTVKGLGDPALLLPTLFPPAGVYPAPVGVFPSPRASDLAGSNGGPFPALPRQVIPWASFLPRRVAVGLRSATAWNPGVFTGILLIPVEGRFVFFFQKTHFNSAAGRPGVGAVGPQALVGSRSLASLTASPPAAARAIHLLHEADQWFPGQN